MTLAEVKELLKIHNISFEQSEYENENEYWHHVLMFPYTANAKSCKVVALVIHSNNGKKHIELQFNSTPNGWKFEELRFGGYCYELFDTLEEFLPTDLVENISEIMQNKLVFIESFDLKKKKWCGDAVFDYTDEDEIFGKHGFREAVRHIEKKKSFSAKLFQIKKLYEIFDWNFYQCIIK